jgi:hypothetical protein
MMSTTLNIRDNKPHFQACFATHHMGVEELATSRLELTNTIPLLERSIAYAGAISKSNMPMLWVGKREPYQLCS